MNKDYEHDFCRQYAEWYHQFGYSEDSTVEYVNFIDDLLSAHAIENIVEFGCGDGRISSGIARKGYQVAGLDNNPYLLDLAEEDSMRRKLNIQWILRDVLDSCATDQTFGAGLLLNGLVLTFPDNDSVIRLFSVINRYLSRRGILIVELPNLWPLLVNGLMHDGSSERSWRGMQERRCDQVSICSFENIYTSHFHAEYWDDGALVLRRPADVEKTSFPNPRRVFTVRELDLVGRLTGFTTMQVFGELKTNALFGPECHRRIIYIFRKTNEIR